MQTLFVMAMEWEEMTNDYSLNGTIVVLPS